MNPAKKNEFDRQMADKFKDFTPEVSTGLWDRIATQLAAQENHPVVPLEKKRRFPTWWMSVAATVLVVCGIAYWYNRPVTITYLQVPPIAHQEEASAAPVAKERPVQEPLPEVEPLDIAQLKRVFAKKNRQRPVATKAQRADLSAEQAETHQVATNDVAPPKADPSTMTTPPRAETPLPTQAIAGEEVAAVPDIQPLVVSEEEETLLASAESSRQPFGISNILNYVVGTVDQREEKLVTFSNDSEGSLKLDFNFNLAKNRKKKIK